MLETRKLTFAYNSNTSLKFPDLDCPKGETILVTGPSGCGKTSLLHLLAGFLQPKTGSIKVGTQDYKDLNISQMDRYRGRNIGMIFQQSHFVKALSVGENLMMSQYFADVLQDKERIKRTLSKMNLDNKFHKKTSRLSQGEQQRVSIARALLNNPQLILADEPTAALDDKNCEEVAILLSQQAIEAQAALVIVTHDQRLKSHFKHQIELT